MPLEGLGMQLVLPEGFPLLPLDLGQREGGGASGRAFGATATFYVRLALPPHLCTFDEVMGWESRSERFLAMFSVVSPASSLHARRGGEAGEIFECRSC